MKFTVWAIIFLLCAGAAADPVSPTWDFERLQGFAEHKSGDRIHDREREKGKVLYGEETEQWERQRRQALEEHRKLQKSRSPQDDGPEHLADIKAKAERKREDERIRREYVRERVAIERQARFKRPVSEMEELGLVEDRPRFDLRKRVMYGGASKVKPGGPSSGGSYGGGGSSFPSPPSSYEDFPPPPAPDPFVPPPMPEDMGAGEFPPPVPPMSDEGMDFPPPPPPAFPPDMQDFPPPIMPEGF